MDILAYRPYNTLKQGIFLILRNEGIVMEEDFNILYSKLKKLENRITSLRLGRSILMDLLIEQENAKNKEIEKLNHEIKRLNFILKNRR